MPDVFPCPLLCRAALKPKSSSSVIRGMLGSVCCALLASQAGADWGLRWTGTGRDGEFCCIGELRGLKSIILFLRLPVETFVLVEIRMVLFSILGAVPEP